MTKIERAFEALRAAIDEAIEDARASSAKDAEDAAMAKIAGALGMAQKQKPGRKKGYRQSQ